MITDSKNIGMKVDADEYELPSKDNAASVLAKQPPERVASLLGASTEIIYRLGLGDKLIARSHECDWPIECLKLPCISRPRMDPTTMSSSEIDDAVHTFSANEENIYKLQDTVLSDLQPDLLILQSYCRVCAITKADIDARSECHQIPQLILKPKNLYDCLHDVLKVANAMGYPARGKRLYDTLQSRMTRVENLGLSLLQERNGGTRRPRVALLEWCDPVMGCGYWLPELVTAAGGEPIFSTEIGGATPTISFQALCTSKPDVVVLALCGFSISRSLKEIGTAWTDERILLLQQACGDQVYIADGNFLFNRSGPRVVESAEVLLEAIHPSMRGHFGHYNSQFLMHLTDALDIGQEHAPRSIKNRPPVQEVNMSKPTFPPIIKPKEAASEMVARQLSCLRSKDPDTAFAYNSTANQKRWCDATQFLSVLESHNDFKTIFHETPVLEESANPSNGVVNAKLSNGSVLIWTCVVEIDTEKGSVWRTERVGVQ